MLNFLLTKYKSLLKKTAEVRELYEKRLDKLGIRTIKTQPRTISNNHKLVIKVEDRDGLSSYLQQRNIQTQIHYPMPMSAMPMFKNDDHTPNAKRFCERVLSLPIHPFLTEHEIDEVCKGIGDFYGV